MDEKDLKFDRTKHVCYSKQAKAAVLKYLSEHYPGEEDKLFERIQLKYVEFLLDQPYLGGKKSTHNGAGGTYDSILVFACYDVLDRKIEINDIYELCNSVFMQSFEKMGKVFNCNHPCVMRLMQKVFESVAKGDDKALAEGAETYIMKVEPYDKTQGVRYRFDRCPIADFAKKHGYLEIMPALCNGDYPAMELLHAGLIRRHTCANGDVCDYWIVGDKSELLKEHPRKTDENGYFYND